MGDLDSTAGLSAARWLPAALLIAALCVSCGGTVGSGGTAGDRMAAGAAATFSKSFGGPGDDEARSAIPTSDGGYVFVGGVNEACCSGTSDGQLWITKLDANGDVQWQRAIGDRLGNAANRVRVFNRVRPTADGGYVVAGVAGKPGFRGRAPSGNDVWVAKLSADGSTEWTHDHDSGTWRGFVGTLVYLSGVVFRLPCRITVAGAPPPDHFKYLCYSDIGLLYAGRGLLQGNTPYLDSGDYPVLEYPVLTGWFLELERLITRLSGGLQGTDLTDQQRVDSTLIFVDVNTVLLGALFLVALWALVRTPVGRPWDAMMLAASPCVAAAALINWDMLPIALTALGHGLLVGTPTRSGRSHARAGCRGQALSRHCCSVRSSCSACELNGWETS